MKFLQFKLLDLKVGRLASIGHDPVDALSRDDEGAQAIAVALGELVQTAEPIMMAGGFHTPNHRWVLVAAQAQMLYPELRVLPAVEAYLGEGIDINADGEYMERSTGV